MMDDDGGGGIDACMAPEAVVGICEDVLEMADHSDHYNELLDEIDASIGMHEVELIFGGSLALVDGKKVPFRCRPPAK